MRFALVVALLSVLACSSDPDSDPTEPYLGAPLCSTMVTESAPNEVFKAELLPPDAIDYAYPFGDTTPNDIQEVINHELGFYIKNQPEYANVALTAPADLYVTSVSVTRYDDDTNGTVDRKDYGIAYEVCSHVSGGVQQPAIAGNFAHVKSLSSALAALIEDEEEKLLAGTVSADESPLRCDTAVEAAGTCTLFVSLMQETNPTYQLVLKKGSQFGTTAFPGIDANLRDYRKNGGAGNYFIQPTRWGGDTGMPAGWKYAACTYEYFAEPYKTQYLSKIGANGIYRNDVQVTHPCGLLEADLGAQGTAAGYWIEKSKESLFVIEDMSVPDFENILSGLLVLSEHFLTPNTHLAMSTHIMELSGAGTPPEQVLVEFPINTPPGTFTNVPFKDVEPGTVYCYEGTKYLGFDKFSFLLSLTNTPEPLLTIERIAGAADCNGLSQEDREFTGAKMEFVR